MKPEQMKEVIGKIAELSANRAENEKKVNDYGVSNRALIYQQDSAAKNANSLAMYRDMAGQSDFEGFTQDAQNDIKAREMALKA
jgi:hypothetical protein